MYKQKFFSFKRDRYYLLELTYNFAFQAVDYALFEPAYVALGNAQHIRYLLLRVFTSAAKAEAQGDYAFFSVAEGIYGV